MHERGPPRSLFGVPCQGMQRVMQAAADKRNGDRDVRHRKPGQAPYTGVPMLRTILSRLALIFAILLLLGIGPCREQDDAPTVAGPRPRVFAPDPSPRDENPWPLPKSVDEMLKPRHARDESGKQRNIFALPEGGRHHRSE
jgi:hypothetical protein